MLAALFDRTHAYNNVSFQCSSTLPDGLSRPKSPLEGVVDRAARHVHSMYVWNAKRAPSSCYSRRPLTEGDITEALKGTMGEVGNLADFPQTDTSQTSLVTCSYFGLIMLFGTWSRFSTLTYRQDKRSESHDEANELLASSDVLDIP